MVKLQRGYLPGTKCFNLKDKAVSSQYKKVSNQCISIDNITALKTPHYMVMQKTEVQFLDGEISFLTAVVFDNLHLQTAHFKPAKGTEHISCCIVGRAQCLHCSYHNDSVCHAFLIILTHCASREMLLQPTSSNDPRIDSHFGVLWQDTDQPVLLRGRLFQSYI